MAVAGIVTTVAAVGTEAEVEVGTATEAETEVGTEAEDGTAAEAEAEAVEWSGCVPGTGVAGWLTV